MARLIRIEEVMKQTGLARTTIYEQMKVDFPASVKITARATAWSESEVQEWIALRIRAAADRSIAA